jgi:hypothetical protein
VAFIAHLWLNAIVPGGMKNWRGSMAAAVLLLIICPSVFSRPVPAAWQPAQMKPPPVGTNSVRWHSIKVTPNPDLPKIHFYNKLNPVWWFGNMDDPVPPAWFRPDSKHRVFLWHLRNPFHNFDHYVIGISDRKFVRSGKYPERNSSPDGGWNFAVARRKLAVLPFLSYQRGRFNFYFGWRERGDFGIKVNFSTPPEKTPKSNP